MIIIVKAYPVKEPMGNQYFLGSIVIAKNESMVIEEFIQHYLWQGVEQIYFIDNGSTDDTKDKLTPYIDKGLVKYYYMPERYQQSKHYNTIYNTVARQECKWIIVCDVDEYMYNRTPQKTIKTYLAELDYNHIGAVTLNWKMFGSSDQVKQPAQIRLSFVYRQEGAHQNVKSIINTSFITHLNIHTHDSDNPNIITINSPSQLALNHYAIMSKEYFEKVKMTRGDVDTPTSDNVRNWDYFARYDFKDVYDDELKILLIHK